MRSALVGALLLVLAPSVRAEVRLTMHDGRVSLTAKDATVRQILTEWEKVGQTKIVNAEALPGGPVSLLLVDVPEEQALDILLRNVSGYLAAPRSVAGASVSRFDRVFIMPASAVVNAPARPVATAPTFPQPRIPQSSEVDSDNDVPTPNAPAPAPPLNQRGPTAAPSSFPPPVNPVMTGVGAANPNPQAPATPPAPYVSPTPTPAPGVSVPGMIVQPTPQPGQQAVPSNDR